jgi:hypothetical protein
MDEQKWIFVEFIAIAVALAIYGVLTGRWLTQKALKLEAEGRAGGYKGLKAQAMWLVSFIALIYVPLWIACFGYRFHLSRDRMDVVLTIALLPSCLYYFIYNVYHRLKAEKK